MCTHKPHSVSHTLRACGWLAAVLYSGCDMAIIQRAIIHIVAHGIISDVAPLHACGWGYITDNYFHLWRTLKILIMIAMIE